MANTAAPFLSHIKLKQFRCFENVSYAIDSRYVLIEGSNGVGKTSLLEALYYACYLRSFRTYSPRELVAFGQQDFFIKLTIKLPDQLSHDIQIGFNHNKRLVKVDGKPISCYKDLMHYYRIINLTEDDLDIIKGAPLVRRAFIDQTLLLIDHSYGELLKRYRQIVEQRNALLQYPSVDPTVYRVMTEQIWELSYIIQQKRSSLLDIIQKEAHKLHETFIQEGFSFSFSYKPRKSLGENFNQFYGAINGLYSQECRLRRTLFGAHLDDIAITFHDNRHSRSYASRGQQKLIMMLLKIAQLNILASEGYSAIFLLDDFMTDFDEKRAHELVKTLDSLSGQLIFTTPTPNGLINDFIRSQHGTIISLTR